MLVKQCRREDLCRCDDTALRRCVYLFPRADDKRTTVSGYIQGKELVRTDLHIVEDILICAFL